MYIFSSLIQKLWASNSMVEYRPFKARVEGSSPSWLIFKKPFPKEWLFCLTKIKLNMMEYQEALLLSTEDRIRSVIP